MTNPWTRLIKDLIHVCSSKNVIFKNKNSQKNGGHIFWEVSKDKKNLTLQLQAKHSDNLHEFNLHLPENGIVLWKAVDIYKNMIKLVQSEDVCYICTLDSKAVEKSICGRCFHWVCDECRKQLLYINEDGVVAMKCPYCRTYIEP